MACPACNSEVRPTDRFCSACGEPLGQVVAPIPRPAGTPQSQWAHGQPSAADALRSERKVVTVMFADIVGSTQLIERLDPEPAMRLLEPGLQAMFDCVHRFGGTVARVQGDGVMALFGAPVALEDHALRACLSGLALIEKGRDLAQHGLKLRVGLNSGIVVVRSIGNDISMNYEAVGATVHLAARMEQTCQPGTVRLTANTYRLAESGVSVRPLGPVSVKGVAEPLEVYELLGRAAAGGAEKPAVSRGRTRFVGRDGEMAELRHAMELSAVGSGQVVSVVGPAGVGKSRLVREATETVTPAGWTRLHALCAPYDQNTAFFPLRQLLRAWLATTDDGNVAATPANELESILGIATAELQIDPAPLRLLLDIPMTDTNWELLDTEVKRQRVAATFARFVIALSVRAPVVIVVEDIHWADVESRRVLDVLPTLIEDHRCFVILTGRSEELPTRAAAPSMSRIELGNLSPQHAVGMLDELLGGNGRLDRLKRNIAERTAGTPLFVEETAIALMEAGSIDAASSAANTIGPMDVARLPDSLMGLISSRIDRLPPASKLALQIAAVIGSDVPSELLSHVLMTRTSEAASCVETVVNAELLRESDDARQRTFTFRHALLRDAAYGSLLQDQRIELHRAVLAEIERDNRLLRREPVERLAHHALAGEVWNKALEYCTASAQRAYERSALGDAVRFLEHGLSSAGKLEQDRWSTARAIDLRVQLRKALWPLGRIEEANDHLAAAERLAKELNDRVRLTEIAIIRTQMLNSQGALENAIESGVQAREMAKLIGNEKLSMSANFFLSQSYLFRGELAQAIGVLEPDRKTITGQLRYERLGSLTTTSVLHLVNLSRAHALRGEFALAIEFAEEACRIGREAGRTFDVGFALHALGGAYLAARLLDDACQALEPGLQICEANEFWSLYPLIACQLGFAYALQGRSAPAVEMLKEAMRRAEECRLGFFLTWSASLFAKTLVRAGSFDEAAAVARAALVEALDRRYGWLEVWLRGALGNALPAADPAGLEHLRRAVDLARALGMRPDEAECLAALGDRYRSLGRLSNADDADAAAHEINRALGKF